MIDRLLKLIGRKTSTQREEDFAREAQLQLDRKRFYEEEMEAKRWRIRNKLEALGNTADEVANSLRTAGIKGKRCISFDCPIARYLNKPWYANPSVDSGMVSATNEPAVQLPEACKRFVYLFDNSTVYQDLEDRYDDSSD